SLLLFVSGVTPDRRAFPTRRSSDLATPAELARNRDRGDTWGVTVQHRVRESQPDSSGAVARAIATLRSGGHRITAARRAVIEVLDRKSTRLNSSHVKISYAVFCLKK